MSDHSWVHVQIVLNIGLRLLRLLVKAGVEPAMVTDHGMGRRDAEVVVAAGALLHDVGMSIHRTDHEAYSLFLADEAAPAPGGGLRGAGAHRRRLRDPARDHRPPAPRRAANLEAGVVRVADALDMAEGRSRVPSSRAGRHPRALRRRDRRGAIEAGTDRPVRIEIKMNNSAGVFQVDDLLATKLRGTPLESHLEVVATVEGETEKRLLSEFRLPGS